MNKFRHLIFGPHAPKEVLLKYLTELKKSMNYSSKVLQKPTLEQLK